MMMRMIDNGNTLMIEKMLMMRMMMMIDGHSSYRVSSLMSSSKLIR